MRKLITLITSIILISVAITLNSMTFIIKNKVLSKITIIMIFLMKLVEKAISIGSYSYEYEHSL